MVEHDVVGKLRSILECKEPTVLVINRFTEQLSFELHFGRQRFVIDVYQLEKLVKNRSLPKWIVDYLQHIGLLDCSDDDRLPMPV